MKKLLIQRIFSLPTLRHQDLFFFPGKVFLTLSQSNFPFVFLFILVWVLQRAGPGPQEMRLVPGWCPWCPEGFFVGFLCTHPCSGQPSALFTLASSIMPWSCPWLYPPREGKVREGDVRECRCSHSSSFSLLPTDSKPQPSTYLAVIFACGWPRVVPTFQILPQWHHSERSAAVEGKEKRKKCIFICRNVGICLERLWVFHV